AFRSCTGAPGGPGAWRLTGAGGTGRRPPVPFTAEPAVPRGDPIAVLVQLPSRIRRGRPGRLLLRAAIAAALSLLVLNLIPGSPAAPADLLGLAIWFVLTGRHDLAPPPER